MNTAQYSISKFVMLVAASEASNCLHQAEKGKQEETSNPRLK